MRRHNEAYTRKYKLPFLFSVFLSLITLGIFFVLQILSRASSENQISDGTLRLIQDIRNEDVIWHGTFLGLLPELTGSSLTLKDTHEDINPLLIESLLDTDKYVAAHVLLTMRTPRSFSAMPGEFNNLKVNLSSDGTVSYDGNNLVFLWICWKQNCVYKSD